MRLGIKSSLSGVAVNLVRGFALFLLCVIARGAMAQAPYVLPYTMNTLIGPAAVRSGTFPQFCTGTSGPKAYDSFGNGCPANMVNVGIDPHDVRVDPLGNVFFDNNGASSNAEVQKYNPKTGLVTVYAGAATSKCSGSDVYGDGCVASDNLGNASTDPVAGGYVGYTTKFASMRGMGMGPNGDLYMSFYNGNDDFKVTATSQVMSLVAGLLVTGGSSATNGYADNVSAPQGELNKPRGIGPDIFGNVYIADTGNSAIRKISITNGFISTVGGGPAPSAGTGCTNGPIAGSLFDAPEDVQTDSFGNVYVADASNDAIRALYIGSGTIINVSAPTLNNWYTVVGVPGCGTTGAVSYTAGTTQSALTIAVGIRKFSIDRFNNLYLADSSNQVVWFVDHVTGYIRAIGGQKGKTTSTCGPVNPVQIGDGCPGTQASLNSASDMGAAVDQNENVYISDAEGATNAAGGAATTYNSRIRELLNDQNFPATAVGAPIIQIIDVHVNPVSGTADTIAAINGFVIKGSSDYTIVGTPTSNVYSDNSTDYLVSVQFSPTRPGADNAALVATTTSGLSSSFPITGTGTAPSVAIDPGALSVLPAVSGSPYADPAGVFADASGDYYIADAATNRVYFYNATLSTPTITVIAGTGTAGYSGDSGLAIAAKLKGPKAVTVDAAGNVYIADTGNNAIRRVDAATGIITTYAGGATTACSLASDAAGNSCPATQAILTAPAGVAIDTLNNLYISDQTATVNTLRVVSARGYISYLAGGTVICVAATDTFGDGCTVTGNTPTNPTGILLKSPAGLTLDTANNLYIADSGNNIVRKMNLGTTLVTLVAGNGQAGSSISSGSSAALSQLNGPQGVAVDAGGNVYIADTLNHSIRMVTNGTGLISTIAGINGASGTGTVPGSAIQAQLSSPAGVAVTGAGTMLIADSGNARVLVDNRTQAAYNFGRTNVGASSAAIPFTEVGTGSASATLGTPLFTTSGNTSASGSSGLFTLVPSTTNGCSATTVLAAGATCGLVGQFSPTASTDPTVVSATYAESSTTVNNPATPQVVLSGVGVVLIKTTTGVSQSVPATGSPQYGGTLTVKSTITPNSCAPLATVCAPTGTTTFVVDGVSQAPVALAPNSGNATSSASQTINGLSVGTHSICATYSSDLYYASSTSSPCASITVTTAATTTGVTVAPSGAPGFTNQQFTTTVYTATVTSQTTGIPTGSVTFYGNGTVLGTGTLGSTGGIATATFTQQFKRLSDGSTLDINATTPVTYTAKLAYAVSGGVNAQISTFSITSNVATFVGPNTFSAGDQITLVGFDTNAFLNSQTLTVLAAGLSSTQFEANVTAPNMPLTEASDATLPPGTYSITATYNSDANYSASTSTPGTPLIITADTPGILLASKSCNEPVVSVGDSGVGAPVNPSYACLNDITQNWGPQTSNTLYGGVATPVNGGTPGGPLTGYTLCPVNLACPQSTGQPDPNPANFLTMITFAETNNFTPGEVVTISGATTIDPSVPVANPPSINHAPVLDITYTVLSATSTSWSGILTSYVGTGQGASIDATIFIQPTNNLTGTLTYSCSGLPANSDCTFNPTVITLTAGTAPPAWIPLVVTFFTDLQPGSGGTSALHAPARPGHKDSGLSLALLLGWPVTLAGLAGLIRFRKRKGSARSLTLLAVLMLMIGSSALFTTGCNNGPGAYHANLTPAGTYPVTVTVTNGTVSSSIVINLFVGAPGIPGQE